MTMTKPFSDTIIAKRLRVPAWSDWFMRGETHCTIIKNGTKWLTVRGERSGKTWKVSPELVLNGRDYTIV